MLRIPWKPLMHKRYVLCFLGFFTDFQIGIALQEVNLCLEAKEMIQEHIVKPDEKTLRSSMQLLNTIPFSSHSDRWGTDYIWNRILSTMFATY